MSECAWLIDWLSEELNWLIEWVSKWSSTSLILKADKKWIMLSEPKIWTTRKHKLNFPQVFLFHFFLMKECRLINKCPLFTQVICTLASHKAGDSGARVPWFDLSIFPTVHVSLNISAPNLLIPCPNPHISHSNKSVKNWCKLVSPVSFNNLKLDPAS